MSQTPVPRYLPPYREVTLAAIATGVVVGIVLNAAITYSGLKIGFTIGGSAVAAVLGWGVLRGLLGKGTIVENNICQTIASSINTSNSGVIFTIPVLFLLGIQFDPVWVVAACMAGAVLGVAFIIPTRKQMIDLERLRFPTGTAVAAILRSPGEGVRKAQLLVAGIATAMIVMFFANAHVIGENFPGYPELGQALGIPGIGKESIDVGLWIQSIPLIGDYWHPAFTFVWSIAPFALGAGFITGAPGLVVLAGGILAYFVISPVAFEAGWVPAGTTAEAAAGWANQHLNRPLGIGMLMGGAMVGLAFALPAIGAALKSMRSAEASGAKREEMPLKILYIAVVLAFALLFCAARATIADGSVLQALTIAVVGTAWMWFAGIVIAQCTGMTDWSPISGMALLTIVICLLLTGNQVVPAVLIGAAVCVAITECADMMQDLKTGSMVGGIPVRQQMVELSVVWIGPAVCLAVCFLLAAKNEQVYGVPFGPDTDTLAPQALALGAAIDGIRGGDVPYHLYGMGAVLGSLLSLSGIAGLGVLVGLSMYLPLAYLLPYGLGCLIQMLLAKLKGVAWTENYGVPFAAGLLVGDGLIGIIFAAVQVAG